MTPLDLIVRFGSKKGAGATRQAQAGPPSTSEVRAANARHEQRTYPFLDLTKRRRPQRKRFFNRRWPRPRSSNHGCPWIQKPAEKATVVLGGEDRVSAIGLRLVHVFCGASILAESLNVRILTGQTVDPAEYAQVASCLVRIGTRLGLQRQPLEVEDLQSYLHRVYGGAGEQADDDNEVEAEVSP